MQAIRVEALTKTFRVRRKEKGMRGSIKAILRPQTEEIRAVHGVSFGVEEGEMLAFIGPNGAGKSTTIKMLTGILYPDGGRVEVLGIDPTKKRRQLAYQIGTVFGQKEQLWTHLTPYDNFRFFGAIYDIPDEEMEHRIGELAERFDLHEFINTPVRNLSLGQRIRCEIVASLIHRPKVLFLDEPTIGLDAVSKIAVRQFVKKIKEEKHTTVVLTTHDMMDIEALADRVLLIGHGRILLDGTLEELKRHTSTEKIITIKYTGSMPAVSGGMELREAKENQLTVALDPAILPVSAAIASLASQTELLDVSVTDISAEEVVAALYKEYRI